MSFDELPDPRRGNEDSPSTLAMDDRGYSLQSRPSMDGRARYSIAHGAFEAVDLGPIDEPQAEARWERFIAVLDAGGTESAAREAVTPE